MRSEVIDAVDRLVQRHGQALGRAHPDQEGAHQAGPRRHRDRVNVAERHPRLGYRAIQGRFEGLEVRPARDLGHDTAEACLLIDAGGHRVRKKSVAAHEGDTCLIA